MAVYVNTNVSSLNGRRYLNNVQNQLTTTYQRLSSGMRINSAKDDAAGLQISSRLTTQVNGLNQGNRNSSDGIALAQTIEGALDETSGMLQKIRTLAVQAANGTNTAEDRTALQKEADALVQEISRIAKQTTFAGKKVLDGVDGNGKSDTIYGQGVAPGGQGGGNKIARMTLQVGANSGDTIDFDVANFKFSAIAVDGKAVGNNGPALDKTFNKDAANAIVGVKFDTVEGVNNVLQAVDVMIGYVDSQRAGLGAVQNNRHPLWC